MSNNEVINNWEYVKNDKNGNIFMVHQLTGEKMRLVNGGHYDNYTVIHYKSDGTIFIKKSNCSDCHMYIACVRDGDTYEENWQEEVRKEVNEGKWTLEELINEFAKISTTEQVDALNKLTSELN